MRAALLISIMTVLSLLSLAACDGTSNDFSPGAGTIENAPELTDLDPEANDSSADQGSAITATFDKNMVSGSPNTFVVYGSRSGKLLESILVVDRRR